MNNWKYSKNTINTPNIYTLWLAQFTKLKGPAPKKPSNAQFYMRHLNHINKFTEECEHQVEENETPAALQINLRNKVVKQFFVQEPESVQQSLRQENQEVHNELMAEYNTALKGTPSVDQVGQDRSVISSFSRIVIVILVYLALSNFSTLSCSCFSMGWRPILASSSL
jgi:hypothetical protein